MTTSEEKIKYYLNKYQYPETTKKDILKTCRMYEGLGCNLQPFDFSNGMKKDLINLSGTIPVPFKGKVYNIPICIWLMDTHPNNAPLCYVLPTPDMCIKVSLHTDYSGKIYLPYLHNWTPNVSNVSELIAEMISKFSVVPPVYAKAKGETSQSPYPKQSYMGSGGMPQTPYPVSGATPSSRYPPYPLTPSTTATTATSAAAAYPRAQYPPYPVQSNAAFPSISARYSYNYPPMPASTFPSYMPTPSVTSTTPLTSANTNVSNTGTITDEHIRASLMSAIEDKLRRKINEQKAQYQDEMEILLHTQKELTEGKNKLDTTIENLKKEKMDVDREIQELRKQEMELEKVVKNSSPEDPLDVDDTVIPTAPLYKQILNAYCEDLATEDTIYYIGEGLRKGVIDLDIFIKQVRSLSRKQLMLRSLVDKCRAKAGLAV